MWQAISHQLSEVLGRPFKINEREAIQGGDVNQCYCIGDDEQRFFVKLNDKEQLAVFKTEAESLRILNEANCVQVPQYFHLGTCRDKSFLILNYLPTKTIDDDAGINSANNWLNCTYGVSKLNLDLILITILV